MKSVIIGAGTYGEVYLAYLQEAGIEIVGFWMTILGISTKRYMAFCVGEIGFSCLFER